MDVSALDTSIPHDDGIAATASILNTNNSQSPDAILQLIRFILDHNVFTFDNQFFTQTHGTAMGTKFAPQYANIFMHKFEQDFFTAQDLQPTLYTRYIDDIFFLWTHGEESLKRLHNNINKFHPTIKLTMDYSSESVSFLDTRISIKDGHLSTSLYRKPMDNLTMLHFSSFHPNHVKEAIPYGQALRIHRVCSDEEERDGHLQTLKDALVRTGYDARLIDRQFRRATAKNRIDLLRRLTWDATNRVPFVVQYFPGAEKLRHVLRSLQHVINDDNTSLWPSPHLHYSPLNSHPTSNRPSFAANYPAFRRTASTTPHNPATVTSARHARLSTQIPPSHERTPPTRYMVHTPVTRPTLSTSYIAGKDAPDNGTLARPCKRCDNG
ncbi:uncharacterized protein [Heptranchias perlo]|uniref:uncharacterized protein n=1 Tax=Heptranchias perlo TaxID=212740 RepID=UPI00355A8D44